MKSTSLILNVVLIVAVAIIYVLHFSSEKSSEAEQATESSVTAYSNSNIAYLKVDSLIAYYELAIDLNEDFSKDQEAYSKEYSEKRTEFEEAATAFQEKLQSGGFATEERAIQERDRLLSEEEEITNLEEDLTAKLAELQDKNSQMLEDSIMNYLNLYNSEKQYSYILDATEIIIGDEVHNITKDVLDALNTRYKGTK